MFVSRSLILVAAGAAAGLLCAAAAAAPAGADNVSVGTVQTQPLVLPAVQPNRNYFLQRIPGTDKVAKVYVFTLLDRNHDGKLQRSEIPRDMHMLRARFVYADINHDGRLSPGEYMLWSHHWAPSRSANHAVVSVWTYPRQRYPGIRE